VGHLSFQTAVKERTGERITFDLGEQDPRKERFTLVASPSILPLLALGSAGDLDMDALDPAEVAEAMGAIFDFFRAVLEPGDWRKFRKASVRLGLDGDDLLPIIRGLVEAIFALPTGPPSGSPVSPSIPSTPSTAGWPSVAAATPQGSNGSTPLATPLPPATGDLDKDAE